MKNTVNPPNTVKTYMIFWWLTCWVLPGNASWNSLYLFIFRLRIPPQPKQVETNINHYYQKLQVTRPSPVIQGKKTYMRWYASPLANDLTPNWFCCQGIICAAASAKGYLGSSCNVQENKTDSQILDVSENSGFSPQIIHLFIGFSHYEPSILGMFPLFFGNTHIEEI